jgi:hypothetical protein
MALSNKPKPKQPLLETLLETKINKQLTNWLAYHLVFDEKININLSELNSPFLIEKLANIIIENKLDINQISHNWSLAKTDDSHISWIKDDERQQQWIINYISVQYGHNLGLQLTTLTGIELIKATLDTLKTKPEHKKHQIENIKQAWFEHAKGDKIFEWFEKEDKTAKYQSAWALISSKQIPTYLEKEFSNKKEILMFFDKTGISKEEKIGIVKSIKNKYSQEKRRREKKVKNQYNFILRNDTIKKLDGLCEKYNLNRTQIIELLIIIETEKNSHLPEQMRRIQSYELLLKDAAAPPSLSNT